LLTFRTSFHQVVVALFSSRAIFARCVRQTLRSSPTLLCPLRYAFRALFTSLWTHFARFRRSFGRCAWFALKDVFSNTRTPSHLRTIGLPRFTFTAHPHACGFHAFCLPRLVVASAVLRLHPSVPDVAGTLVRTRFRIGCARFGFPGCALTRFAHAWHNPPPAQVRDPPPPRGRGLLPLPLTVVTYREQDKPAALALHRGLRTRAHLVS